VEKSVHDDEYLYGFDADAEGWPEREPERDLMSGLVEAAHLKSAARAWYRRQAATTPTRRTPPPDA